MHDVKHKKNAGSRYPRLFERDDTNINLELRKKMNSQTSADFIKSLCIDDILRKGTRRFDDQGMQITAKDKRNQYDRARLKMFVKEQFSKLIKAKEQAVPLFEELVENIVDKRMQY